MKTHQFRNLSLLLKVGVILSLLLVGRVPVGMVTAGIEPSAPETTPVTFEEDEFFIYLPLVLQCYPLAPQLNPIANPEGDGMYTLTWSWPACGGTPSEFEIQGSTNPNFIGAQTFNSSSTSLEIYSPDPGTYYWRVRGVFPDGPKEWSNVQSTTVTREFAYLYIQNDTGGNLTVEVVGVATRNFAPGLHYWRSFVPGTYTVKAWAHCGSGESPYDFGFGIEAIRYYCIPGQSHQLNGASEDAQSVLNAASRQTFR